MAQKKSATSERNRPTQDRGLDFSNGQNSPVDAARSSAVRIMNSHAIRELVESLVVAFVLAFLIRTFVAEVFVIPTGSMAPTLQGRHKDLDCPMCGYQYRASASEELDAESNRLVAQVFSTACPMCRYRAVTNIQIAARRLSYDPEQSPAASEMFNSEQLSLRPTQNPRFPWEPVVQTAVDEKSYSGDRIIVNKFCYDLDTPRRWDVIVFRFPEDANKNYIKRLVGLPGETLEIHRGNLFTKPNEAAGGIDSGLTPPQIARKPPRKIRPMAQIVYDNNYVVDAMTAMGWPTRWQAWPSGDESPAWTTDDGTRSFHAGGKTNGTQWIRYQHFPPSFDDWETMIANGSIGTRPVKPQLITDTYQYNSSAADVLSSGRDFRVPDLTWQGIHWVGDLVLEADVEVKSGQGKLLLDLVEGGFHFTCSIDVSSGAATLSIVDPTNGQTYAFEDAEGNPVEQPTATTQIDAPGRYSVAFANVDDQLALWVNGSVVRFAGFSDGTATYSGLQNQIPHSTSANPGDLAPAGIGSDGADLMVGDLKLSRDVYYIAGARNMVRNSNNSMSDYKKGDLSFIELPQFNNTASRDLVLKDYGERRVNFLSTPDLWPEAFTDMVSSRFVLEEFPDDPQKDQFFAAGDNSPASSDSRLWNSENFFERDLLIGKAVFIYWPHSLDKPFPFFPNFKQMKFVH